MRAWLLVGVVIAACSNPNVGRARQARYDAEASVVFDGALAAVRDKYGTVEARPMDLEIKTAWHQVGSSAPESVGTSCVRGTVGGGCSPMPRTVARRQFVRFDVRVSGERPYRVEVEGHAAEWAVGAAVPSELGGAARPGWLDERRDALAAAIYQRLRRVAVTAVPATAARADRGAPGMMRPQ